MNTLCHIADKWACSTVYQEESSGVCQHTCSFWANAVGLVSARSGSRYCRGSSHSDSLSGKARAGEWASKGHWIEGYRGTGRSRQRAVGRRAGISMAKQALSCLRGSVRSCVTELKLGI